MQTAVNSKPLRPRLAPPLRWASYTSPVHLLGSLSRLGFSLLTYKRNRPVLAPASMLGYYAKGTDASAHLFADKQR